MTYILQYFTGAIWEAFHHANGVVEFADKQSARWVSHYIHGHQFPSREADWRVCKYIELSNVDHDAEFMIPGDTRYFIKRGLLSDDTYLCLCGHHSSINIVGTTKVFVQV